MTDQRFFQVHISPALFETLNLAGVDAYAFGRPKGKPKRYLETAGFIWGFKRQIGKNVMFYLDRGCHNVSGKRTENSVTYDPDAARTMAEIYKQLAPQLTLLGDFHTHPYDNLQAVATDAGYEFSDPDRSCFLSDDVLWQEADDNPLMLVLTVANLQRVRDHIPDLKRPNVTAWSVKQFRLWLNVIVGYLDEQGERRHTSDKRSSVRLIVPGLPHYNPARSRVELE